MNIKKLLFGTDSDPNAGLVILRVFVGFAMLYLHGWAKMFGGGLEQVTGFVASLGIPAPATMAFLSAAAESFGAILLALGLLTRPAALILVLNMTVAVIMAHGSDGFAGQELGWLYLVPALFFVLKGAGRWSLDALIDTR